MDEFEKPQAKKPVMGGMNAGMGGGMNPGQRVRPAYEEDVDMDAYSHPKFDENAYMRNLQEQTAYETCVKCLRRITPADEQTMNKMMLCSTDCFHLIHRDCFKVTLNQQVG
jgi:hypothetical protein